MAANPDDLSKQVQQLAARVSSLDEVGVKRVEALNAINKKTYDQFMKMQARVEQLEKRFEKAIDDLNSALQNAYKFDKTLEGRVDKVVNDLNSALQNAHKFDKGLEARIVKLEKTKR